MRFAASEILAKPPEEVLRWVEANAPRLSTDEFHWLTLADGAASMMRRQAPIGLEESLCWAKIAIAAYERARADQPDPDLFEDSIVNALAFLIETFGPLETDTLRNPARLTARFLDRLPMSAAEAKPLAERLIRMLVASPQTMSDDDISALQTLRGIKNRLRIYRRLEQTGIITTSGEMDRWLDILETLP